MYHFFQLSIHHLQYIWKSSSWVFKRGLILFSQIIFQKFSNFSYIYSSCGRNNHAAVSVPKSLFRWILFRCIIFLLLRYTTYTFSACYIIGVSLWNIEFSQNMIMSNLVRICYQRHIHYCQIWFISMPTLNFVYSENDPKY